MRDLSSRREILTVAELNQAAREAIEQALPALWVAGEISNFRRYDSGHCYFVLKDAQAQVRCVMFRHRASLLGWQPTDGSEVELRAVPSLYEARGDFQLNVETMRRAGLGALFAAFERLKAKLSAEGLFAAERKRPLPSFPRTVGIVTSTSAAALRDMLTTLRRRAPGVHVIVYPALVQGEDAGRQIARAIALAGERAECDVLIVGRGGGSIEDLWAFNEEVVARALAASPIPTVSAVGHETDFTIADFVADARATTPTAAAVMVVPDAARLHEQLQAQAAALGRAQWRLLEQRMQTLDHLSRRLTHPGARARDQAVALGHLQHRLAQAQARLLDAAVGRAGHVASRLARVRPDAAAKAAELARLAARLSSAGSRLIERRQSGLAALRASLAHLNPEAVLERGYSITRLPGGKVLQDARDAVPGTALETTLAHGSVRSVVG
ncbi:MAG: exodeoxyribonuclease VII large subunit [Proteobacteria bacterium]|nr:exodeoxyribonuclease VII large subunit [Pseudomonadota bacterium]